MPDIRRIAPARPTAGDNFGGNGSGSGSPTVVSFWGVVDAVRVGTDPGTREKVLGGAELGTGACDAGVGIDDGGDVSAGAAIFDDCAALASASEMAG